MQEKLKITLVVLAVAFACGKLCGCSMSHEPLPPSFYEWEKRHKKVDALCRVLYGSEPQFEACYLNGMDRCQPNLCPKQ